MRMRIIRIAADTEVGDHARRDELLRDEVAYQRHAFIAGEFDRQPHFEQAGELRIFPHFARLDFIPQRLPVAHPRRRFRGSHDLGVHDAAFAGVIMRDPIALIAERGAQSIGRRGHDALPSAPGDDARR